MSDPFPSTNWGVVLRAGDISEEGAREALAELYQMYWFPLYGYVRRRGYEDEDARDLLQAYFVSLMEKRVIGTADRDRGRFRAFLLITLKRFLATDAERTATIKRGGHLQILSLNHEEVKARYERSAVEERTPEDEFDRRWTLTIVERVTSKLAAEARDHGGQRRFSRLRPFLLGDVKTGDYEKVASGLGMQVNAVKVAVFRLRRRFGKLLREEIARTVESAKDVDDEIRHLFGASGAS